MTGGLPAIVVAALSIAGTADLEPAQGQPGSGISSARVDSPAAGPASPPSQQQQPPDDASRDPGRFTVFPIVSYSPETSVQGSAFVIYSFSLDARRRDARTGAVAAAPSAPSRSTVSLVAAYTLKNQYLASLSPSLYFDGSRWRLGGSLLGLWYPDVVYATGPDSPPQSAENYTQRAVVGTISLERELVGRLRLGGQAVGFDAAMTRVEPGRLIDQGLLTGSRGGSGYGFGPMVARDDRDRELAPQRGGRQTLLLMFYPRGPGADFSFRQLTLDLREYIPFLHTGHVVAVQLFSQLTFGDPPFQLMPTIGGDGRMRGFFASRFRDLHTAVAQLEYRAMLVWRLGLVAFGGVGDVAHRLADFDPAHFRVAGGGGLRVALDQKEGINLRVDVGRSSLGDTNLYVALGEGI